MRKHVHRKRDHVAISRSFAVAEQRSFYSVRACEQSEFRRSDSRPPVVVGMNGKHDVFAVLQVFMDIFHLLRIDVRHSVFDRSRKIDDRFTVFCRLPDVQHRVYDFQRVFRFRTRKTFGRIFETVICSRLFCEAFQKFRAVYRDPFDLLFGFPEYLFALCNGRRVVNVNDHVLRALDRLERLFDNMFPCLGQYLNRHVVGNQIFFDERSDKLVLRIACGGKPDFDFFKTDFNKQFEKIEFCGFIHGFDKRLVSVAQINAAPNRRALHHVFLRPVHTAFLR